jgi:hypothetical protein
MAETYTLTITNHFSTAKVFMLYQNQFGNGPSKIMPLAWISSFSSRPEQDAQVVFQWTPQWGFSCAETGVLAPGVIYKAKSLVPAQGDINKVTLEADGLVPGHHDGPGLAIVVSPDAPKNKLAVGFTQAGSTVYAIQAAPSSTVTIQPHPAYVLTYGHYKGDEVIDLSTIVNPLVVTFPANTDSLAVTLNQDGTWGPVTEQAEPDAERPVAARGERHAR